MAYQTEIERALNEIISLQEWLKFQNLAVILAQQKWPQLVASEPNWDRGLDGHASGCLASDGQGIGLACSLTATLGKIESDATKVVANYPDVRVLIFATPEAVTKHTEGCGLLRFSPSLGCSLWLFRAHSSLPGCRNRQTPTSAKSNLGSSPRWPRGWRPTWGGR